MMNSPVLSGICQGVDALLSLRYTSCIAADTPQSSAKPKGAFMDGPRSTAIPYFHRLKSLGGAAAGAVLIAGLAAGCSAGGGSANSPITICEIAATSGPFSALGTNDELGATAWAAMVNKAGGIQGHQVKLVPENDASTPATAAALVHKCVSQDHANFIFGPESTATTAAAVPIANQLQTVLLGWGSGWAGQGISDANMTSYAFPGIGNVYFADDQAMITQIIVPRHYTRVALIQDNTPGGLSNLPYIQSRRRRTATRSSPARSSTRARRTTRRRCSTC